MEWLLPAGAWAFASVPAIIALYLLRRRATRHEVSSLLLWQRTESVREASKPFQKLRKQWLLILQLLLAALLSLALLRPALPGMAQGEVALIFDVSASMQATQAGKSRLGQAVEEAASLVDSMKEGDAVTILTAGSTVGQVLARSTDKLKMRAALRGLQAENGTADLDGALSLAKAMGQDLPELSIVVYSDTYTTEDQGVEVRAVGSGADNRSVLSLRCSPQEGGLLAFARIANYGAAADVTMECYADGALVDVRTLSLPAGRETGAQFSVPMEAQAVWVALKTPDALEADNVRYWVAQQQRERRVLLVTRGNIFLEKALALRQDIQVFRTTAADAGGMEDYDLVILDGESPGELPATGSLLALAPDREILGIRPGEVSEAPGRLRAENSPLAKRLAQNLLLSGLSLRAHRPLTGGESVLSWGDGALLTVAEQGGRRAAVIGFDLHDSNLPMQADFPILMQNLMDYLLPEAVGAVDAAYCGRPVDIAPDEWAVERQVLTPTGKTVPVEGTVFAETGEIGIYALKEERADGRLRITPFVLHMAPSEADLRYVAEPGPDSREVTASRQGTGMELRVFFLLAMLLLSMVEWEVSRRGA